MKYLAAFLAALGLVAVLVGAWLVRDQTAGALLLLGVVLTTTGLFAVPVERTRP